MTFLIFDVFIKMFIRVTNIEEKKKN